MRFSRHFLALPVIAMLALFVIACDGDDDEDSEPTAVPPTVDAPADPTAAPESPTTEPEATQEPEPTPAADPSPTPGVTGDTDPFSFPADPDPASGIATLTEVRVGEHPEGAGFDRIVFEFEGDLPAGMVEYVEEAAQCGSGLPVEDLEGGAMLTVRFDATQAHNEQGEATIDEQMLTGPGNSILESRQICDFEGIVEWVIGVESELAFEVTLLEDPSRVAIDVALP